VVSESYGDYTATVFSYARLAFMVPPDAEEEGFKVTDRRRQPVDDEPPATPPSRSEPPRAASPPVAQPTAAPTGEDRNLTGLFVMLATSAAVALGQSPDPLSGEAHRDLSQAAELIDVLLLLREKTEGHLTPEESQVLDEVLYDLQLRYVEATKRSAR
jgi:hypothetical protein